MSRGMEKNSRTQKRAKIFPPACAGGIFYGIDAQVYYEKAIRLCIAQGRICLLVIRDSEIVQILLKSVLCS